MCTHRSQPVRCLILAGPSKEQLQDFLRYVPEGKHAEKLRVLQGTELHLQVRDQGSCKGYPRIFFAVDVEVQHVEARTREKTSGGKRRARR
jgi:hypothetical protein